MRREKLWLQAVHLLVLSFVLVTLALPSAIQAQGDTETVTIPVDGMT